VASEVDEEEETEDHAKREGDGAEKDSIDADTKEGLDNTRNKVEEAIDVFTRDGELLASKLTLSLLTLEEGDDAHDIEADGSKKSEEEDPADETDNGEVVADKKDEEDVDDAESKKGLHEVSPHEDLLGLAEEFALLEGLADHVARALARAGRGSSLRGFLLGFLSSGLFSGCRLFCCRLFNGCGFLNFVRHCL